MAREADPGMPVHHMSRGRGGIIVNASKGVVLADEARRADTFWRRLKGLLGRTGLSAGEALLIPSCSSVHTFFMRFPIDVLFIDRRFKVVKTIHGLAPFRLTAPAAGAWGVIELASGTLHRSHTIVGDLLQCTAAQDGG